MKRTLVERVAEMLYDAAALGLHGKSVMVRGWAGQAKLIIAMVRRHDSRKEGKR